MAAEVFFTVCYDMSRPRASLASEHSFLPAVLSGYSRRRVAHQDYPGVIEQAGHSVRGTLARGLTAANLHRLDYFEGFEYERRRLKVTVLSEDGAGTDAAEEEVEAFVYVFKDPARLESREWDYDEFRREKLKHWSRADYAFDGARRHAQFLPLSLPVMASKQSNCKQTNSVAPAGCDPDEPASVAA